MVKRFVTVEDARSLAQRRLPRMIFDYIDGAAGDELSAERNQSALKALQLMPRSLVDIASIDMSTELFGRRWQLPFGIAPMGMCEIAWPGTDRALASTARERGIPIGLSTAASTTIEAMREMADTSAWFQLYVSSTEEQAMSLVDRAEHADYDTLLLTVDAQRVGTRPRDQRNGFGMPPRIGPKQFIDFAIHPQWSLTTLARGVPNTANFISADGTSTFNRDAPRGCVDSAFVQRLRERWQGHLIVKGVLSAADAVELKSVGVDAIYVSNHGGRQLEAAPAAIECLGQIRQAVGPHYPLLFDSGVRDGEGIVKALAAGADFVLLGRPFLYASAAAGRQGIETLVDLLSDQLEQALSQIGVVDVNALDARVFWPSADAG